MKIRKHLSASGLFKLLYSGFEEIEDHRAEELVKTSLADTLMSAFAMFSLKDPSLLAFDERRRTDDNLKRVYGLEQVPCDTQMRTTLDEVEPSAVKSMFKDVFRELQRGKELEKFVFMEDCYLLSLDGTGYFGSVQTERMYYGFGLDTFLRHWTLTLDTPGTQWTSFKALRGPQKSKMSTKVPFSGPIQPFLLRQSVSNCPKVMSHTRRKCPMTI